MSVPHCSEKIRSVLKTGCMTVLTSIVLSQNLSSAESVSRVNGVVNPSVCKPSLITASTIEMGNSGLFNWKCDESSGKGAGFYIVFIRPSGTYILLKVPLGKNSFEFTPDASGLWRWMVINTDPDRSRPDVESEPGNFQVINVEQ